MAPQLRDKSATQAERVLESEYEQLRRPTVTALRSRLASQRIRFDDADLDAFYNQAWHGLYEQLVRGEQVDNHAGFLVQVAYRRSIDELRRQHPDQVADDVDPDAGAQEVDLAQRLDDRRRMTGLMEGMRERLSERECQAAALCYLHGYSRPEAAEALGLPPRRMEKLMDGVSQKMGSLVSEIEAGKWCESRQSLMKAYAFGVLDPDGERYQLARAHLDDCSACRRYVLSLRGLGAIVPPVVLPLAALSALGIGGGAAASGGASTSSGSAGGGGAAAGGAGAGAGAAAGAGGFGGLAGGWALAAAAAVVVAAGGLVAWAVVSNNDGGDSSKSSTPAAQKAPASSQPASGAGSSGSGSGSSSTTTKTTKTTTTAKANEPAKSGAQGSGTTSPQGNQGTGTNQPASNTSPGTNQPATTPVAQQQPASQPGSTTPSTQNTPAAAAPADQPPTSDGSQEFGFER